MYHNEFIIPIAIAMGLFIAMGFWMAHTANKRSKKKITSLITKPILSESEIKEGWEIQEVNGMLLKVLPRDKLLRH